MSKIEQLRQEVFNFIQAERDNFIRDGQYKLEEWPEFVLKPEAHEGQDCYQYVPPYNTERPIGISIWFSETDVPEIHYMFVVEGISHSGSLPLEGGLLATIVAVMVNETLTEKV